MKEKDTVLLTFKGQYGRESTVWYHKRDYERMIDWDKWGRYDKYKFWEKYPESKPLFESTKVILDEVDKMPFASEEHRQAYINSFNNK